MKFHMEKKCCYMMKKDDKFHGNRNPLNKTAKITNQKLNQ
jgi:hypothetical protein